jgi:hypothetical protein
MVKARCLPRLVEPDHAAVAAALAAAQGDAVVLLHLARAALSTILDGGPNHRPTAAELQSVATGIVLAGEAINAVRWDSSEEKTP